MPLHHFQQKEPMARKTKTDVVETATQETELDGIDFIEKAFADAPVIEERKPAFRKSNPLAVAGLWIAVAAIAATATGLTFVFTATGASEVTAALVFVATGYTAITVFAPISLALSIAGFVAAARSGYWYGKTARVGKGTALAGVLLSSGLLLASATYAVTLVTGFVTANL